MKTKIIFSAVLLASSLGFASSHDSSTKDLNCYSQIAGDFSTEGNTQGYNALLVASDAINYKGALSAGVSETAKLTAADFTAQNQDQAGAKLLPIINKLNITVKAEFKDGVIDVTLNAGGKSSHSSSLTNWDRAGSRFSIGERVSVDLDEATAFRKNDKIYVEFTCVPGSK